MINNQMTGRQKVGCEEVWSHFCGLGNRCHLDVYVNPWGDQVAWIHDSFRG